ncbi:MAG: S46 family peptidase [Bacteroidota bacterium]|nr:S46 family peptidase [Bacteroidota bacterium]
MKKLLTLFLLVLIFSTISQAKPDEGMWLPLYIKQLNMKQMKKLGFKLSAKDIYDINNSSMKDAVVRLGKGFCTGEIVSEKGLVFTNHHCGFSAIADLSSVDNDFLENGFWAKSFDKEIPIPDFSVSRLVYMKDLTFLIDSLTSVTEDEDEVGNIKSHIIDSVINKATKDNHFEAEVKTMFAGTEYFLLVYETFNDVRFVAAPPSSIGKFGGDTDNWMWPRHTGDFSILRIYMSPDGKPAEYNEDNVPYKPLYHFPISLKGIERNDFSMILGYPGTTERYLTSYDIAYKLNKEQPAMIDIFGKQLSMMKQAMDADHQVRIDMASQYAGISNYYKYLKGQSLGLEKFGLVSEYKQKEEKLIEWINSSEENKEKYGELFNDFEIAYNNMNRIMPSFYYAAVGISRLGVKSHISDIKSIHEKLLNKKDVDSDIANLKETSKAMFEEGYYKSELVMLKFFAKKLYKNLSNPEFNELYIWVKEEYKGKDMDEKFDNFFEEMFSESDLFCEETIAKFIENPKKKYFKKDLFFKLVDDISSFMRKNYMAFLSSNNKISTLQEEYFVALREWKKDETFYPDANSTMRLSYGKVIPYHPKDAVYYHFHTTHYGILSKEDPNDSEFKIDPKLHKLLENKNFGPYAEKDTLMVCFLSNNDITGGNSGSPVINGNGELIGIAFDGNWEAMTGDLVVDPSLNRTISVDIRYVLFVIDKFAGATNLIDELDIVTAKTEKVKEAVKVE